MGTARYAWVCTFSHTLWDGRAALTRYTHDCSDRTLALLHPSVWPPAWLQACDYAPYLDKIQCYGTQLGLEGNWRPSHGWCRTMPLQLCVTCISWYPTAECDHGWVGEQCQNQACTKTSCTHAVAVRGCRAPSMTCKSNWHVCRGASCPACGSRGGFSYSTFCLQVWPQGNIAMKLLVFGELLQPSAPGCMGCLRLGVQALPALAAG